MLSYTVNKPADSQAPLLIMGLGGVGHNLLQNLRGCDNMHWKLCSVQADQRLLDSSECELKISIGQQLTRGLGCGGDPELGALAMSQSAAQLESLFLQHKVLLLGVGLGGGTGSGAAPVIARLARENGVYVVVFACVPFSFEGRRRLEQARTALGELSAAANALIVFENDRMGELLVENSGVEAAFSNANKLMANAMQSVARLATRPGLFHLGLDDLASVLRGRRTRVLYGFAEAEGEDRAQTALKQALASPLIERKHHFGECKQVVVHVCVGKDVKLSEIEQLMSEFSQLLGAETQLHFGLAVVEELGGKLALSIIAALPQNEAWQAAASQQGTTQLGLGQLGQQLAAQPAAAATLPGMPHRSSQQHAVAAPAPTAESSSSALIPTAAVEGILQQTPKDPASSAQPHGLSLGQTSAQVPQVSQVDITPATEQVALAGTAAHAQNMQPANAILPAPVSRPNTQALAANTEATSAYEQEPAVAAGLPATATSVPPPVPSYDSSAASVTTSAQQTGSPVNTASSQSDSATSANTNSARSHGVSAESDKTASVVSSATLNTPRSEPATAAAVQFPAFPPQSPAVPEQTTTQAADQDEVDIKAMVALANELAERDFDDDDEDLDIPPSLRSKK